MPRFSKKSLSKLETCDKRLQDLFLRVVKSLTVQLLKVIEVKIGKTNYLMKENQS